MEADINQSSVPTVPLAPYAPDGSSSSVTEERVGNEQVEGPTEKVADVVVKDEGTEESRLSAAAEDGEKAKQLPDDKGVKSVGKIKALTYCAIPNCRKQTDQLVFATFSVLAYYGVRDRMAQLKVCLDCVDKANKFQKESVEALRSKRCLFELKHEPQHIPLPVEVNDNVNEVNITAPNGPSSSITPQSNEQVQVDFDRTDVESLVKSILQKFKIKRQVQKCTETAMKEATQLESDFSDINAMLDSADDTLYDTCRRYNQAFDKRPQPYVTEVVEINADGSVRTRSTVENPSVFADPEALKRIAEKAPGAEPKFATSKLEEDDIKPITDEIKKPKYLLPTPPVIPRIKPKQGDIVYAMFVSLLNPWLQAEVLEIIENPITKEPEFIVHYEPTKSGKALGGIEKAGSVRNIRQLCMRELAYNVPFPFHLPVGTRVIALFKDEINPKGVKTYHAGTIGEPARRNTNDRYLIFFDDGYAQYVVPNEVLVVCESSNHVWNEVHPDAYEFIKDYVSKYPEWPKVRLLEGSLISTEWNGKWLVARVVSIDCSLAKVRFENDGREEWIYRGSPRFRPIYRVITSTEDLKENKIPKRQIIPNNSQDPPVVHETNENDFMRNVQRALKSTAARNLKGNIFTRRLTTDLPVDPELCIEFQGTVTQVKIPNETIRPKDFVSHDCSESCVIEYVPSNATKGRSPLAIPLYLGWEREVGKFPRDAVFYRTPCGLRLRDYDELSQYLKTTGSNLSLDFFSFEHLVNCLNQFVPARANINLPDISYGREAVPVQCVNSIDHDTLPYIEYTPGPVVGPDVNLSTDSGFMVCCDCTDDCQDQEKCACWKLTKEGVSFTKLNDPNLPVVGYENRRLKDHIVSGIYECNVNCKCRKTCTNRVVQNGVMWPVQIFKTARKGWGIRALYDMPAGAFICIYAGDIFTDQFVSAEGYENGDEYLAQLDFIEILEDTKEHYESDVSDIEEEEDNAEDGNDELPSGKKPRLDEEMPDQEDQAETATEKVRLFASRRTGGQKTNLDYILNNDEDSITGRTRLQSYFNPKITEKKKRRVKLRSLYSHDEQMYLMDAKSKGNFGRYLNHSCIPNVFVQNVFVSTHDLRFPMVAFFTNSFVKAGTELTWDYHYLIGSVPDKSMHCYCMTPYCRGRLL